MIDHHHGGHLHRRMKQIQKKDKGISTVITMILFPGNRIILC